MADRVTAPGTHCLCPLTGNDTPQDRDHQGGDCTKLRKTAIISVKIGLLRGHAEKTSTNARSR
jgi:hypothetical protein